MEQCGRDDWKLWLSDDGELKCKGLPGWGGGLGWAEWNLGKDGRLPACDGQHVSTFPPAIVTASLQSQCPEASTRDLWPKNVFEIPCRCWSRSPRLFAEVFLDVNICRSDDVTTEIRHSNWKTTLLFSYSTMPNLLVSPSIAINQCRSV
jgi:hypothetical protein